MLVARGGFGSWGVVTPRSGAMAAKVRPLFVYGSLLSPEVLRVLLRRVPRMRSATIRGFRRYGLLERPYPAVCADAEGVVKGEIIFDLEPSEAVTVSPP